MIRGLVLAGGKSRRFGSDKALATYEGARLIDRAVWLLDSFGLKPMVSMRFGTGYPFIRGVNVIYDRGEEGPLGGVWAALSAFKSVPFLVVTCDMPALTPEVIEGLLGQNGPQPATVYSVEGVVQPFPGIYGPDLAGIIRERLDAKLLSLQGLLESVPAKRIEWAGDPSPFLNVNRPEDLKKIYLARP